ncbi:hypothetical protein OUZ56_032350 [Daphnia magna]|uniref:ABC transporter domain-containing protein n=1 Tax=Daphnia magna TaxID=35525 RepID=A0ABR0B8P5_9CRUS|nr:hypothetical protein OUZ56_032350 [Daphnia magna]
MHRPAGASRPPAPPGALSASAEKTATKAAWQRRQMADFVQKPSAQPPPQHAPNSQVGPQRRRSPARPHPLKGARRLRDAAPSIFAGGRERTGPERRGGYRRGRSAAVRRGTEGGAPRALRRRRRRRGRRQEYQMPEFARELRDGGRERSRRPEIQGAVRGPSKRATGSPRRSAAEAGAPRRLTGDDGCVGGYREDVGDSHRVGLALRVRRKGEAPFEAQRHDFSNREPNATRADVEGNRCVVGERVGGRVSCRFRGVKGGEDEFEVAGFHGATTISVASHARRRFPLAEGGDRSDNGAVGTEYPVELRDVRKSFGSNDVIKGSRKTTLLRMIVGLERPTSGQILIDGEDIAPLTRERDLNRVRQKLGMVYQYAALLDSLTVMENVAFPLIEHTKLTTKEIEEKVVDKLRVLGLDPTVLKKFPAELSGGMRKRVGLARALMLEPKIIVYDEPNSGLDPISSRVVDDLIDETRERFRVTSVVISHDIASIFRIAHQAILVIHGKVVAAGTPDELAYGDNEISRDFIDKSGVDGKRARSTDPLAVSALIFGVGSLVCGALTGVPAVLLGWVARRRLEPGADGEERRGSGLALAGIVTGLFGSLVSTTVLVLLLVHGRGRPAPPVVARAPKTEHPGPRSLPRAPQDVRPEDEESQEERDDQEDEEEQAFRELFRRGAAPGREEAGGQAAGTTKFGDVTFVAIDGGDRRELAEILASEGKLAAADQARLLVYGGGAGCGPCASFEEALAQDLLQKALGKSRILAFDTSDRRRSAELLRAGFDVTKIPAFFLLDATRKPSRRVDGAPGGGYRGEHFTGIPRLFCRKIGRCGDR